MLAFVYYFVLLLLFLVASCCVNVSSNKLTVINDVPGGCVLMCVCDSTECGCLIDIVSI